MTRDPVSQPIRSLLETYGPRAVRCQATGFSLHPRLVRCPWACLCVKGLRTAGLRPCACTRLLGSGPRCPGNCAWGRLPTCHSISK